MACTHVYICKYREEKKKGERTVGLDRAKHLVRYKRKVVTIGETWGLIMRAAHARLRQGMLMCDPTYSTVQEQQTGFSTRFDDQHEFYVCIGDAPPKKNGIISLQHLQLDRCPKCPRRRKPSHRPTSASLKLVISLVIHR